MRILLILAIFCLELILMPVELEAKKGRIAMPKKARITKYVWTGKTMANRKWPKVGYVAVSDRRIKLGSLIWIGRTRYIVGDYTAQWVHEKTIKEGHDLTVDVYTDESRREAIEFGEKFEKIALLKKV